MAWTDLTSTIAQDWPGLVNSPWIAPANQTGVMIETQLLSGATEILLSDNVSTTRVVRLQYMNIPGYEDGYIPCSTPSVIANNLNDGCEAGSTTYTITASGTSDYLFSGGEFSSPTADPTLNLVRGQEYIFNNTSGAHPFQIQSTSGIGGTAYNDGVTNNGTVGIVTFLVPNDAPSTLYYQCTSHAAMGGTINITGSGGGGSSNRPTSGMLYPRFDC